MASQLTRNELAALVSLAAAIGVPILSPDRGILPALVIAVVVVGISRLIAVFTVKSQRFESLTQGAIDTLVQDGVMDLKTMLKVRITRERLMAQLRCENLVHLGQVKRLYIESNGGFTLIPANEPKPGLPVIPDNDKVFLNQFHAAPVLVCHTCGMTNRPGDPEAECPNCKDHHWVNAITEHLVREKQTQQRPQVLTPDKFGT